MVVSVALSLMIAGCGATESGVPTGVSTPPDGIAGASQIALTRSADTLLVDQSLRLVAVIPPNPGGAVGPGPVWTSSDSSVAAVTQAGLVFALRSGNAVITVASRGSSAATKLAVRPSVRSVRFEADTLALGLSQSIHLPFRAIDSDGNSVDLTEHRVEWLSSTPEVAPVTSGGGVVGKTLGASDVRLTIDGKASMIRVQVKPQSVSSVTVTPSALSLGIAEAMQLTARVADASGVQLTDRLVTWSSSNSSIAVVSSTGRVMGVSAGTARITAVSENKRGYAEVTVTPQPASPPTTPDQPVVVAVSSVAVTLNASALTVGQTTQANAVVKDAAGNILTDRPVSWTSSDASIAGVDGNGLVSATRAGSAVISGSVEGKSGDQVVVVSAPTLVPRSITVSSDKSQLVIGELTQATAVVRDANGTVIPDATVTWSSSPSVVATVSVNGVALGRSAGTAIVSASTAGVVGNLDLTVIDTTTAPPAPPVVARVAVTLPASSLDIGATTQASAIAYDASGQVVTGRTVTWTSSNALVATVSDAGVVRAVSAGTAGMTAVIDGQSGSAFVTVTALPPNTVAGTYYVSPLGSDANPGTAALPWKSLTYALPRLRAGNTLYLRGGTYQENVMNPSIQPGQPASRITVAAYPGERPVIVGLLWLSKASYWTLDGVNVTWNSANVSTQHMVKMTNGTDWVYENSELWGAHSFANLLVVGTVAGEPANWIVRQNCVHDTYASNATSQDHNMYVNTGITAGAGLLERNIIFNAPNGENVKLGYGRSSPQPGDGTANVTVRYTTMYRSLKPMLVSEESHSNTIERNIIYNSGSSTKYAFRAWKLTGASNVFRNNVFYGFTSLQYADPGYALLTDGGGNKNPLDPKFDGVGCGMFKPTDATSQAYGRFAP
jgi:uncharacterized protein YjdB